MAYGTIKVDTITFTDAGVDKSVTISGLVQNPTFSGNITVTGTVSGNTIRGQTVSGATITGGAAAFTTVTGGVATITSGVFALGSASNPSISFSGDANSGLYSPGADQVAISTNGTGRLFVDASGNVGLNALTPNSYGAGYNVFTVNGSTAPVVDLNVGGTRTATFYAFSTNTLIGTQTSTPLQIITNGTEKARITSDGKLGLGTTFPDNRLDVDGAIGVTFTDGIKAFRNTFTVNNTILNHTFTSGRDQLNLAPIGDAGNSAIALRTSAGSTVATRVLIDELGRVGIGTTSPAGLLSLRFATDKNITFDAGGSGGSSRLTAGNDAGNANVDLTIQALSTIFVRGGTESARIDSSGRLLVGTSSSRAVAGPGQPLTQIHTTAYYGISLNNYTNDAGECTLHLTKSRGTSVGSQVIVQNGDRIGDIRFEGSDGTNYVLAASIKTEVDGTPGTNDMPGRLVFSTTADGASSPTERMRIDSAGQIEAGSLGTAAAPVWSFLADTNTGIYSPGADQVAISTNGTGRLFIDSSGRVTGQGFSSYRGNSFTTASFAANTTIAPLNIVQGNNGTHPSISAGQNSTGTYANLGLLTSELYRLLISPTGTSTFTADASTAPVVVNIGVSEVARIDSSGRVGLGTANPQTLLHVAKDSNAVSSQPFGDFQNNGQAFITGATNPNKRLALGVDTTLTNMVGVIQAMEAGITARPLALNPSGGNVGIGSTTPRGLLSVSNNSTGGSFDSSIQIGYSVADYYGFRITNSNNPSSEYAGALKFERGTGATWSEAMRLDNSGRLLVGTSSNRTGAAFQIEGTTFGTSLGTITNNSANSAPAYFQLIKSRGTSVGSQALVSNGDGLGNVQFVGTDGTQQLVAAAIEGIVDGTPGTNDMPGRLVFSTTADGTSSPTEALRITNDRVIAYNQTAPAAVNATATLTVANLKTGIITSTSALATDMTLPTGTDTQAGFSGTYDNFTFEWSVINTGPSLVRVLAGTAHTIVGSGSVATGTSGRFASRRTAANTFVTYRLS
jgi:hypothetical protein